MKMGTDDGNLLREYAERHSEEAFATLVGRHVNLVYSVALRQVRTRQLAEEVAQSVFTDLAKNADKLRPDTILTAWLYRVACRTAIDVVRSESRRQLREQKAMEAAAMNSTSSDWSLVEPLLEEGIETLDDTDRSAILLRYFENKSLREVGDALGISEDAAQKRVSRAVDQLRESFTKRGVTVGTGGLVVVISANAVQAAPAGLATAISSAAALAGATIAATTTATITKAIAMTTLQKSLIAAAIAASVGTGIYEAQQASQLRQQNQALEQQQASLTERIRQVQRERNDAIDRQAMLQHENEQLHLTTPDIVKLRAEVMRLQAVTQSKTGSQDVNDPFVQSILTLTARAMKLNQYLEKMPDKRIPELEWLEVSDWLDVVKNAELESETGLRKALSTLRRLAKSRLYPVWQEALRSYLKNNNNELPTDLTQLKPFFKTPVDDAVLRRYQLLRTGNANDLEIRDLLIDEKAPVDKDYDERYSMGLGCSSWGRF